MKLVLNLVAGAVKHKISNILELSVSCPIFILSYGYVEGQMTLYDFQLALSRTFLQNLINYFLNHFKICYDKNQMIFQYITIKKVKIVKMLENLRKRCFF